MIGSVDLVEKTASGGVSVRIVLLALGSRGDVTPMVSLGRALHRAGLPVVVVALDDFGPMIAESGLSFAPVGRTLTESVAAVGRVARRRTGARSAAHARDVTAWLAGIADDVAAVEADLVEPSDLVIAGLLSLDDAAALAEARGCRAMGVLLAPLLPTAHGPSALVAPLPERTSRLNRWAGAAGVAAVTDLCTATGRHLRARLGVPRTGARGFAALLRTLPLLLANSPLVTPPAPDWPATLAQTGFWFDAPPAPAAGEAELPTPITEFLATGEPPVFVGLGSVPGIDPSSEIDMLVAAGRRAGRRLVIRPADGATKASSAADVLFVHEVPYRAVFPLMAGVVQHGGAGTTAEALLAGVPSVAVVSGADQPYYGRRVHQLGAGPAPIHRAGVTADALARSMIALTGGEGERWRAGAAAVAARLRTEAGPDSQGGVAVAVDTVLAMIG